MADHSPVRIGILHSTTGVTAAAETSLLQGTLLAIDEVNAAGGIHGREIVPEHRDPHSDPAAFRRLAEQLIGAEGVKVIFGCYLSSTRKAVIPIVERHNGLLFYATLYEGFEFSNNVIYSGAAPNQNSVQLAAYMVEAFGPRVYMVGSDYIYPYESNRIMNELVQQQRGGETVAERYLPLDAGRADFEAIMADVRATQPDFIFSTVVGDATRWLYAAYAEAGFDPARMPIASLTTTEVELAQMGAAIGVGHITSAPYFQSIDSKVNRAFLRNCARRRGAGAVPNACWEAAYLQMHLFANAARACGRDAVDALMPCLLGSELLAPQGRVRIEAANHHTWLHPRIGRADAHGQFTIVSEATEAVSPDPYLSALPSLGATAIVPGTSA